MRFAVDEEQEQFRRAVRDMLTAECPPARVRKGADRELWRTLADVGATGLVVPERYGGSGAGARELAVVLEEAGRACLPEPLLDGAVAATALAQAHPATAERWLPGLAAGDVRLAVTLPPAPYTAAAADADLLLFGRAPGGGDIPNGSRLHAVEASAVRLVPLRGIDPGRGLARAEWDEDDPRTLLADGCGAALERAFRLGAIGAAADLLGTAGRMLDLAVAHAAAREQFGRPVGSYQAVKHRLADVAVALAFARPVVLRAAYSHDRGLPSAARDASMAKVFASEAADGAARAALQVHGAIGYTEECDLQLWMRRAWALSAAWGDAGHHRAAVADDLLGPRSAPTCPPR